MSEFFRPGTPRSDQCQAGARSSCSWTLCGGPRVGSPGSLVVQPDCWEGIRSSSGARVGCQASQLPWWFPRRCSPRGDGKTPGTVSPAEQHQAGRLLHHGFSECGWPSGGVRGVLVALVAFFLRGGLLLAGGLQGGGEELCSHTCCSYGPLPVGRRLSTGESSSSLQRQRSQHTATWLAAPARYSLG